MFDTDPALIALRTARGVDLFRRHQDEAQRRARFGYLGTVADDGALTRTGEDKDLADEALHAEAAAMARDVALTAPVVLSDPSTWPTPRDGTDPLRLFLYLDFFRAWQVADMAADRFLRSLRDQTASVLADLGQLPAAILPIYQFNMTHRAPEVAAVLLPALALRLQQGAVTRERADQAGYALRMLGDLCLRAGDPAQAQVVFALSCDLGDNAFRRQKAIEAALAAGQTEIARDHARRYAARWRLPDAFAGLVGDGAAA